MSSVAPAIEWHGHTAFAAGLPTTADAANQLQQVEAECVYAAKLALQASADVGLLLQTARTTRRLYKLTEMSVLAGNRCRGAGRHSPAARTQAARAVSICIDPEGLSASRSATCTEVASGPGPA